MKIIIVNLLNYIFGAKKVSKLTKTENCETLFPEHSLILGIVILHPIRQHLKYCNSKNSNIFVMAVHWPQQSGAAKAFWAHKTEVGRHKLPSTSLVKFYEQKLIIAAFAGQSMKITISPEL